jgi:hypothetical protein
MAVFESDNQEEVTCVYNVQDPEQKDKPYIVPVDLI